jgi:predicted secreted protein
MPRGFPALVGTLAAAAALAGCGDPSFKDPKGTVEVDRGDSFKLVFRVNASVGFDWLLDKKPASDSPVRFEGDDVKVDNPDSAGSGGDKTFRFKADRAGTTTVNFTHYFRDEKKNRRRIKVRVK